jgi:tetratricopeptide (TPR) repeat protein
LSGADPDRLPPPPRLSAQQKVIEDHLRERYAAAVDDPSSIAAVGALCVAYHADMFFDQAERCYEVAETLAPDDWRWIYYRAVIQSERGGGEALLVNLRTVVERAPQLGPAWLRLGEAEFKAGSCDEAATAWQKARDVPAAAAETASPRHVTEVPLSAYASLGLARIALVKGDVNGARTILEQVNAATSGFGPALRLLADSYRQLGREDEATRLVYRAGRLPPFTPYADPVIHRRAGARIAQQHLPVAGGLGSQPFDQLGMERIPHQARTRIRPEQSRSGAEARQDSPHRRAQRRGIDAVRALQGHGAW